MAETQDEIRAKKFVLVDDEDNERAVLTLNDTGTAFFGLKRKSGQHGIKLMAYKDGGAKIMIYGAKNTRWILIESDNETTQMTMHTEDGDEGFEVEHATESSE